MRVETRSNPIAALQEAITEAERLSNKEVLSKADERRYTFLLAQISLLKQGVSPTEIAHAEAERMAKAVGLAYIPQPESDEVEREWRGFLKSEQAARGFGRPVNYEIQMRAQEAGAQSISYTSGPEGGYFVPVGYYDRNLRALRQYDQIFDDAFCNVLESATGVPAIVPGLDDVDQESTQVGENVQDAESDFKASQVPLKAYSFRSGLVFVTLELLQDSGVPVGGLLERAFAVRHARGVGKAMVNGNGTTGPQGIVTAAIAANNVVSAEGAQANTGDVGDDGAVSIGSKDLTALWHALNPAYRMQAAWYLNADTLRALDGLLDKVGRPLIRYSNGLYTLYSRPIAICPSMDSIGPSKRPIVLASPEYVYQRRIAAGSYLRRSVEIPGGIEFGGVAFQSWYRTDSRVAIPNATVPPIVLLQNAS